MHFKPFSTLFFLTGSLSSPTDHVSVLDVAFHQVPQSEPFNNNIKCLQSRHVFPESSQGHKSGKNASFIKSPSALKSLFSPC